MDTDIGERMAAALYSCIEALDDEGHSSEMAAALCESNECWKCQAVVEARKAIDEYRKVGVV